MKYSYPTSSKIHLKLKVDTIFYSLNNKNNDDDVNDDDDDDDDNNNNNNNKNDKMIKREPKKTKKLSLIKCIMSEETLIKSAFNTIDSYLYSLYNTIFF